MTTAMLLFGTWALACAGLWAEARASEEGRATRPPTWLFLATMTCALTLLALGAMWHLLAVVFIGLGLERWRARRSLPWVTQERLRAAVFMFANVAVVGSVQVALFGEVVEWAPGPGGLAHWPLWAQVTVFLVVNDLKNYWIHRAEHRVDWLWRFHRIHHADEEVSILSPRDHVTYGVEKLFTNVLVAMALGVEPRALEIAIAIWQAAVQLNHVNVAFPSSAARWPLWTRLVPTPTFHAWHHTPDGSRGQNLADLFPWWDFLFGTAATTSTPIADWSWGLAPEQALPNSAIGQLVSSIRDVGKPATSAS